MTDEKLDQILKQALLPRSATGKYRYIEGGRIK